MIGIFTSAGKGEIVDYQRGALGVLGATLTFLFGSSYDTIVILLTMVVMDYMTGVLAAVARGKLDSRVGAAGIVKKTGLLFMVALGHMTDSILGLNNLVMNICVIFIFANEGVSIIENLALMGVPVPEKLTSVMQQLREKGNE